MNRPTINPVYSLLAMFGDTLTGLRLAYKEPHPVQLAAMPAPVEAGQDPAPLPEKPTYDEASRFEAGARIASTRGGVIPHEHPGYYSVHSDDHRYPMKRYDVCILPGELACECWDATSPSNLAGLCKHQIAALMDHVMREV